MIHITILGTSYRVERRKYDEDPLFSKQSIDGYCDDLLKEIIYCDITTHPGYENDTKEYARQTEKYTLRHEIVHAFLSESGLEYCSCPANAWAKNEEMVDWFALQGEKIVRTWRILEDALKEDEDEQA